jgi:hypothetical protein
MGHRTDRHGRLTATFLALLALAVAGCGASSTPVAHRSPTPTPTPLPTTTPSPKAEPTPAGMPCGQIIGANNPVAGRVGDLQFTKPQPADNVDPLHQLPDSLSSQPYAVNADTRTYLDAFTLVNVHVYAYAICNDSATTAHVVAQFSVKLNAFTADANTINTSHYCIQVYSRQGMVNHTGCGGAYGGQGVNVVASFVSTGAAVGAVQPALDHSGLQVTPLTLQPGYAIPVLVDVTPATVVGTSIYRFGVGVDGAAPVYPAVDSVAVLNAATIRQWDGTSCLSSAMQQLIPPATTPPTYYICPPA